MCISGTQNYNGQQVFDCMPAQGIIESGWLILIAPETEMFLVSVDCNHSLLIAFTYVCHGFSYVMSYLI